MKRMLALAVLAILAFSSSADARLKAKGRGANMNFDPEQVPANFKPNYDLMVARCVKCHTMERTVVAVITGRAPITGQPFDKQAVKAYGIKMLRKPNSGLSKQEIRDIVVLMNYLIDENARN